MDKLVNLLNNKLNNEFLYLKTLEIVYDTTSCVCTISFLYPETKNALSVDQKEKIFDCLNNYLKINGKLNIKFKKSYLDNELLIKEVLNFFKVNYNSLACMLNENCFNIEKNNMFVNISISLNEILLKSFDKEKIKQELVSYFNLHFCGDFSFDFINGDYINEEEILIKNELELQKKLNTCEKLARYKVYEVSKILGKDIAPEPEYLINIRDNKESVILAGTIENFTKKSYTKKIKGKDTEKFYYNFMLNEGTKKLNCLYFCPKSNIAKMDKLTDDTKVLVIVNIIKEYGKLKGFVQSLSLCEISEKLKTESMKKITTYKTVFPQKIEKIKQKSIFDKPIEYIDNIKNNTFVVFDVETTGLDPEFEELTEIGAVKIVNGEMVEKFQSLIKPKKKISQEITDITSITNEMVADAPNAEIVLKDFYLFSKDAILSGYNVNFDMRFILKTGKLFGIKFENEVQDVMVLAQQKLKTKNYKLSTIVKHLDIELINAHRALNDAIATAEVLLKLSEK